MEINENKKLSAEEILDKVIENEFRELRPELIWTDSVFAAMHRYAAQQTAPLEAEIKRLKEDSEAMRSQSQRHSINNIILQSDYEAIKQKADGLCLAAKVVNDEYSEVLKRFNKMLAHDNQIDYQSGHELYEAITNYEKQE